MRILFLILAGLLLIGAPVQQAFAQQQYPVQIQPTVSFPSTFLNDYADPENTNIRVYLADLTKVNYKINIRIKLEGAGNNVVYENKTGITLTLDGGDVYFLNDQDLKKLFAITDLATNVGSKTDFANVLPEGVYTMSLQAYDASVLPVEIPVSNGRTDFTIFNVVRYDPPMLNAPNNAEAFDMQTINQNIFFTWTPRHVVYSPKQQVKYRFSLIKVIPVDRNPYDAMKAVVPSSTGNLVVSNLDFPTFIYSPADLPLEEGCVYAWQVQAYEEVNGIEKAVSRFKNEGYSEVYTFSIKENCEPVTINPISVSGNQVTLSWYGSTISTYTEYEVNYRQAMTSLPWTPVLTSQTSITLNNTVLLPDVTYEYTVKARCKNWQSPVYGGTFKLEPATCTAPRPITVDTKSGSPVLTWTDNAHVDSIRLYYREKSSTAPFTRVLIAGGIQTYTLPPLNQDGYIVELDAVCGTETAAGVKDTFNYNDNGMIGPCPIPMPFQFSAQRFLGDTATLAWQQVPENTGYSITYWHKDSAAVTHTINNLLTPSTKANLLFDNQLYAYKVTFMCGTKSTTTPVGMFRIDGSINSIPLDPKTADCFPPVELQGQARSTTSAFVEWDKIDGADEYQLFYGVKGTKPFKPFTTTATSTTLKNLEDSKQYQFIVRVRCGGLYSIFSDTALVDLGQDINSKNCDTVAFIAAIKKTTSNILFAWKYDANYTGYVITYRESAQPPSSVYTQAFTNIDTLVQNHLYGDSVKYTFQNLKSGTEYLFTIQAICGAGKAFINAPLKVSTMPDAKSTGTCGSVNACDKTDKTPLTTLNVGEKFHCADYEITVDKVDNPSSPTGTYTGNGHMNMPIAGVGDFVTMSISFSNIKINTDTNRCVVEGMINIDSMNAGLLPTDLRNQISGYMDQVTDAIDQANNLLTQASDGLQQAQDAVQQATDYFQGGENTGGVVTGGLGETKVTGIVPTSTTSAAVSGNKVTLSPCPEVTVSSFPALLKDNDGNVFQVSSTGAVVHVGTYDTTYAATPITVTPGNPQVVFEENTTAKYDFDMWKPEYKNVLQIEREYEKINSDYYVPAKCITPGEMDVVNAKLSGTSADPTKVVFANGKGLLYKFTKSGSTFTINLAGGPAADAQEIYAWYVEGSTKTAIGKLLVPSYGKQTKNVVIIPVDLKRGTRQTINTTLFKQYLDKTYGRLGITYNVTVDDDFRGNTSWDADGNNSVQVTGSSILSNDYQGEEKAMIEAYVALKGGASALDPNTAYFLAPYEVSQVESNLLGKMPAEEQFGFLYTASTTPDGIARTIAHELGHGAYHLEHIFNTAYLGPGDHDAIKNGSLNLMSYFNDPKAIELWKFQWDVVNAPGHVWGILKKDKDAEAAVVTNVEVLYQHFKNDDGSLTFLAPSGKPITIKEKIVSVQFFTNDYWYVIEPDGSRTQTKYTVPYGTVSEFTLETGETYEIIGDLATLYMQGYVKKGTTTFYEDKLSYDKKYKYVITGIPCLKSGRFIYNTFHTNFLENAANVGILNSVQKINKGEGNSQPELFLQNYLSGSDNGQEVYANIDGAETFKSVFIKTRYDAKGDICGKEAIFAFKSAMLFKDDLYNCLDEAEEAVASTLDNGYQEMRSNQYVPPMVEAVSTSVYNAVVEKANQAASDKFTKDNFFEYLYPVLKNLSDVLRNNKPVTNFSDQDMDNIISFFAIKDQNGEENIAGRLCILSNLKFELREKLIRRIQTYTDSDDKEKLIVDLISTTPNADGLKMLTLLADKNYELFEDIYDEVHLSHRDQYVYSISYMALKNWDRKNIAQAMPPDYDAASVNPFATNNTNYVYACGNDMIDCDTEVLGTDREVSPIAFSLLGDILPVDYQVQFQYSLGENLERKFTCTSAPFDFIKVSFVSDFNFPLITDPKGKMIKTNEIVEVPAFWLYYILKEKATIQKLFVVRIIADAAAIAAAVLTAEPGPILVAEAIFAGVDIGVATYVEKISDHDAFAQDLSEAWDIFSLGTGAAFLTKTVVSGGVKFVLEPQKLSAYISDLKASIKTAPTDIKNFVTQTSELLIELAKFSTKYGIDKTKNIFYTTLLSAYMELKIATYTSNLDPGLVELVENGNQLVIKNSQNVKVQIASLTSNETDASLSLTSRRWLPDNTAATTVGKVENVAYIDANGAAKTGDLEFVTTANGQLYLRSAVSTVSTNLQSVLSKIDNLDLPNLKAIINDFDDAAKARFSDDVANLSDDALLQLEDNFGLLDQWKQIDALSSAAQASQKPAWLQKIIDGNTFNNIRSTSYPNNEVYLINPSNSKKYVRLDSYKAGSEIVSRKYTQLSDIQEATGVKYIQELKDKYSPGTIIANVPSNNTGGGNASLQGEIGKGIGGQMILEVPVQTNPIPQSVIDKADQLQIVIRDVQGKIYN